LEKGKERIWKPTGGKFVKFQPEIAYDPAIRRNSSLILYCSTKRRLEHSPMDDTPKNRDFVCKLFARYKVMFCGTMSSVDPATIGFYRNLRLLRPLTTKPRFVAYGLSINMFLELLPDFWADQKDIDDDTQPTISQIIVTNQLPSNQVLLTANPHRFIPADAGSKPCKLDFDQSSRSIIINNDDN
jgi:hypothetical protein